MPKWGIDRIDETGSLPKMKLLIQPGKNWKEITVSDLRQNWSSLNVLFSEIRVSRETSNLFPTPPLNY